MIKERTNTSYRHRGFTLVELMIVVAIIGVLAALAIYGVKRYLSHSKTAEARQVLGGISRAAAVAFNSKQIGTELLTAGSSATKLAGGTLCGTATTITHVGAKKYQPKTAPNQDFNTNSSTVGWKCLKFSISQPISFGYMYYKNFTYNTVYGSQCISATPNFYAMAYADLDGKSIVPMKALYGFLRELT